MNLFGSIRSWLKTLVIYFVDLVSERNIVIIYVHDMILVWGSFGRAPNKVGSKTTSGFIELSGLIKYFSGCV